MTGGNGKSFSRPLPSSGGAGCKLLGAPLPRFVFSPAADAETFLRECLCLQCLLLLLLLLLLCSRRSLND